MAVFIPPELIHEIVHHILDNAPPEANAATETRRQKADWHLIEPLVVSCHAFRLIALKVWFQYLYLKSPLDLKDIPCLFPELKSSWTRHLHCVQTHDSKEMVWDLSGFNRLSSVRIDWLHRHFSMLAFPIPENEVIPFINVDSPVKELDIRGLRYPSPMVLTALTCSFVDLVTLKLDCLRVWCGLCHTCALVRFPPPAPAGFVYEDGFGLPVHYARALFSLKGLEDVYLTLPDISSAIPPHGLSAHSNEHMWTGECDRCMSIMYQDDTFKKSWLDRKRGIRSADVEDRAVYAKPPSLKKVHWKFWKYDPDNPSMTYVEEELETDDEWLFANVSDNSSGES